MNAARITCWTLTGLAALSIASWALFDIVWVAPIGQDLGRGTIVIAIHMFSLGAGFVYESSQVPAES